MLITVLFCVLVLWCFVVQLMCCNSGWPTKIYKFVPELVSPSVDSKSSPKATCHVFQKKGCFGKVLLRTFQKHCHISQHSLRSRIPFGFSSFIRWDIFLVLKQQLKMPVNLPLVGNNQWHHHCIFCVPFISTASTILYWIEENAVILPGTSLSDKITICCGVGPHRTHKCCGSWSDCTDLGWLNADLVPDYSAQECSSVLGGYSSLQLNIPQVAAALNFYGPLQCFCFLDANRGKRETIGNAVQKDELTKWTVPLDLLSNQRKVHSQIVYPDPPHPSLHIFTHCKRRRAEIETSTKKEETLQVFLCHDLLDGKGFKLAWDLFHRYWEEVSSVLGRKVDALRRFNDS